MEAPRLLYYSAAHFVSRYKWGLNPHLWGNPSLSRVQNPLSLPLKLSWLIFLHIFFFLFSPLKISSSLPSLSTFYLLNSIKSPMLIGGSLWWWLARRLIYSILFHPPSQHLKVSFDFKIPSMPWFMLCFLKIVLGVEDLEVKSSRIGGFLCVWA